MLRINEGENNSVEIGQKYYLFFHRPADVEKLAFLVWKAHDGEEKRWLYLSALGMTKQIISKNKRNKFVGSDFVYEEVSGRNLDLDIHSLEKKRG